jgi:cytochrome c oxidase subunit 1
MIHNTIWVPGHFHLTVGTAVALTFMAATYWIWPQISNKPIYSRTIGLVQVVVWFIGMALMSNAMHAQGIMGVPRRTAEPEYSGFEYATMFGGYEELNVQIAIGGTLLFVSTILFIGNLLLTMGNPKVSGLAEPLPPALSGPADSPRVLDNLRLWVGIALTLVVLAYALPIAAIIQRGGLLGPGVGTYPVWLSPVLDALANVATAAFGAVADASTSVVEVIR